MRRRIADVSPLLPALLPELVKRMGTLPVVEPSEEIRLEISTLISEIISRADARSLGSFCGELCTILARCLEDGYHEIKKAGCTAVVTLCARAPAGSVGTHAERLLQVRDVMHEVCAWMQAGAWMQRTDLYRSMA